MLILSRRVGERIVIDPKGSEELIIIEVTKVERNQAKLGTTCENKVTVDREELYNKKRK